MISRRQNVMQVAQQLFIEKGFTETSVQDILNAAQISKGTFYNYFSSKNECLIAILKQAQKEAFVRRKQLLMDSTLDDEAIFAKQIIVRIQINKEHNLLPLLTSIFHSEDKELRQFAKRQHMQELAWLANRFIELNGHEIRPYAIDSALILLGMLQQYNFVWSFYADKEINTENLVIFLLRRIENIVEDLKANKETFIHETIFFDIQQLWEKTNCNENELAQLLQQALLQIGRDTLAKQFIEFFLDEIKTEAPRKLLLKSMVNTFHQQCQGTEKEWLSHEITEKMYQFIEMI